MKYYVWMVTRKAGRQVTELIADKRFPYAEPKTLKNIVLESRKGVVASMEGTRL